MNFLPPLDLSTRCTLHTVKALEEGALQSSLQMILYMWVFLNGMVIISLWISLSLFSQ